MISFHNMDYILSYLSILKFLEKFRYIFHKNNFFLNSFLVHYIKVRAKILVC